jgi:DNA-binding NarL/FixJ family response regulator
VTAPEQTHVRVVLVDDHALVRNGLAQLLDGAPDIEVVGQAADGEAAMAVLAETRPDVVVMDLQMPGVDGVTATRRVVADHPGTQVLVLTSYSDAERIVAALDAGAVGYLLKDADPDDVIEGVRAVSRGESPIHPRAARSLLTARRSSPTPLELTPRETEVLSLVRAVAHPARPGVSHPRRDARPTPRPGCGPARRCARTSR